jgi:hypothetical protein
VHFKKDKDPLFTTYVSNRKRMREILSDEDTKEGMATFFTDKKAGYEAAVKTYNQLKEEAALRSKN